MLYTQILKKTVLCSLVICSIRQELLMEMLYVHICEALWLAEQVNNSAGNEEHDLVCIAQRSL